ncbi:hypothetical protein IGI04_037022 [Brassica rapa subsp. trilocularis]|uniref:TIR domain-containing protein n=1 Tax=Brassica rapa subsp. trilocularis TaxID=1813537 RepID=A0ABQ7LG69_BRACM|nr:hypothetical protein IGI04_037022 [Brassica rapa subsp. trilocularis]
MNQMMKTGAVSDPRSRLKWDIFLSFQRDRNHSFTDRLYEALIKAHVRVRNGDVGRKDQKLGPSLDDAMEDSVAFIVILSPDYAKSRWCLDELAKLCDLRASLGRPILPIFYEVDPWHFRKQSPFEKDFEEHAKRFGEEEIERWRGAMNVVGHISGYVYREDSVDDEMIGLLVKRVLSEVSNTPENVGDYTVGLESRVDDLINLVDVKSTSDVQILGLHGMGGIGKTTLAKAFYNKIVADFEYRVFISNGTSSIQGIVLDFKKKLATDPSAVALGNLRDNPGIRAVFSYLKNKFVGFPAEEKPKSSENTIPVEPFVPMTKLRLLQINHVELAGNLERLPSELKWIQWRGCPLKEVPLNLLARQLAVLDLAESAIRRIQSLHIEGVDGNLKVVNLRGCHSLEAVPDLSNHKSLEKLVFERCMRLVEVPSSVGNLRTLLHLDFRNCPNLTEFLVDVSGLKSLEKLYLSGCSNLSVLPENIGLMPCLKELFLDATAVKKLPDSIFRLENLQKLSLKSCRSIQELPMCIGTLTSLEELDLSSTSLQSLPSSIGDLKNLQKLSLMHCASLSKIPDTIKELKSLKKLFIYGSAVEELPLSLGSLPCLTDFSAGECKLLKHVPSSIGGLNSLLELELDWTPIETLPAEIGDLHFIQKLGLRNCKSLKALPESIGNMDTLHSLFLTGANIEKLPETFGKLENLVSLQMDNCKMIKRLPESFGDLKSLHGLYMKETSVVELPESFGNLSNLRVLKILKKPLFRSSPGTSEEPSFVEVPNSFSNLLSLEEIDARGWGIWGKVPDDLGKLSSLKKLELENNYFHSLPSSLEGLWNLKLFTLYDCQELKCLPPLPWKLEKLNLANCFALESIADLSKLEILEELNLTNCGKVDDVPGLEHLKALKRLYMSGCNSRFSVAVKKRLSKASLKMMRNLSLPGNRIPDWFSQGPLTFSPQPNRELRGVILAVVVALNQDCIDDYQLPDVMEVQAQILELDSPLYTHTLHLSGVPRTSDDQLHICRYPTLHPMVWTFRDGYTIQVVKREPPIKQGVELKMHGIHLVYEGDDDFKGEEHVLNETQLTVSQKLANFFRSFDEGEASSESESA